MSGGSRVRRVYLAGPMTGWPAFNFPAFHERAAAWRAKGWDVFNPAEIDGGDTSQSRAHYLRIDIRAILDCDALAVLPGWQGSAGASLEVVIARELELVIYDAQTFEPYRESVLEEAARHVGGARNQDYGHPLDNHTCTAKLWSVWLERRYGVPVELTPEDVCHLNILQKESRAANRDTRDSWVDVSGYAANIELIGEERNARAERARKIDQKLERALATIRRAEQAEDDDNR